MKWAGARSRENFPTTSREHIYRLQEGKIREHWVEVAMMELLQQIGALPQSDKAA